MSKYADFGHSAVAMPECHMDSWGAGPFLIEVNGKVFRFGDSKMWGPYLATKLGDPIKAPYPGVRSPFWRAHRIWVRQGRRLADDGLTCLWHEPKPQICQRINKRNIILVEPGEEDGALIVLDAEPGLNGCDNG